MKRLLLCSLVLVLVGCSAMAEQYPPRLRDSITVEIHVVKQLPKSASPNALARAYYSRNPCQVYVLDSVYPHAVMHEIMHCFSGDWHKGVPSAEYQHIVD